jgi:hypothetical protein
LVREARSDCRVCFQGVLPIFYQATPKVTGKQVTPPPYSRFSVQGPCCFHKRHAPPITSRLRGDIRSSNALIYCAPNCPATKPAKAGYRFALVLWEMRQP